MGLRSLLTHQYWYRFGNKWLHWQELRVCCCLIVLALPLTAHQTQTA